MTEIIEKQTERERLVSTFGWVKFDDENERRWAVIEHVFGNGLNGLLMIHYSGNKNFRAIVDGAAFQPDRDCYFCEGSYIDPEWEGDSARCTNYWIEGPGNEGRNFYTDELACQIMDITPEEVAAHFRLKP
jgi:hypothetical protein